MRGTALHIDVSAISESLHCSLGHDDPRAHTVALRRVVTSLDATVPASNVETMVTRENESGAAGYPGAVGKRDPLTIHR